MSGVGVAYLPNFMVAADLQAGRLVRVMAAWSPPSRTLYAVYPSQRFLSPKVRAFLDFVIAKVMPSPPWAV
jgi:DNA-binding transcriptional LysR family regulator